MSEITVKPLEWEPHFYAKTDGLVSLTADLPGREQAYKIEPVTANYNFRLFIEGREVPNETTVYWPLDEAKARAQSDFDARIRSALVERKAEPIAHRSDCDFKHSPIQLCDCLSASPSPVDSRELIERLVKALKPFAQAASVLRTVERTTGREFKDEDAFQSGLAWNNDGIVTTITYGHLRAARVALAAKEQQP